MDNRIIQFGYSPKWLEYGVLSEEFFEVQYADHLSSGHKGWEHYRYGAFLNWLKNNASFEDQQIINVCELIAIDVDQPMARSFAKEVISSGKLSTSQIALLNDELGVK